MNEDLLVADVIAVVEREVGPVNALARIELERAIWRAMDEVATGFPALPPWYECEEAPDVGP